MKILFVASEIYPYVKTGGLGDVAAALPAALAAHDLDVRLMLPGYPAVLEQLSDARLVATLPSFFGPEKACLVIGTLPDGLRAYVLDAPHFYDRCGPYGDAAGQDWPDNHRRFAALAWAAADLAVYDPIWRPDIVHGNDWQCGLIPAYMKIHGRGDAASVMTIHNIAYQGLFPAAVLPEVNLPPSSYALNGVEYHDKVGFMKAGLYYADALTTVSPTYAREIQETAQGCGLDGLLRRRADDLTGILNGVDYAVWNPADDSHLAAPYNAVNIKSKSACRAALLAEFGLSVDGDRPVFGVISRLVQQKGLDLLVEAMPAILKDGAGLVVLGAGDKTLEGRFRDLAAQWPGQVAVTLGYDENLAHRIIGGADSVIIPSRFEPCGLVQMYGLRYGALPVVRNTGGLADSVQDGETGFVFEEASVDALTLALERVCAKFGKPAQWAKMQKKAMAQDFSWSTAARKYIDLYRIKSPARG